LINGRAQTSQAQYHQSALNDSSVVMLPSNTPVVYGDGNQSEFTWIL